MGLGGRGPGLPLGEASLAVPGISIWARGPRPSRGGWRSQPAPPCRLPRPPAPGKKLTLSWPAFGAQYVAEAEEKLQRARLLVESVRKEKVDLSNQLEEERRWVPLRPQGHFP